MGRTKPSDILVALDRIYTHKERKDRAEQDMAFKLMNMEFNREAREDQQDFQRESMRMQTKLQYETMYPGVSFKADGYTPDLENYDISQSTNAKIANMTSTTENLKMWNLSTHGTDEELMQREAIYRQGKVKGQNIMAPSISPDIATRAGYDASPGYLTQQDVLDFEDQFYGAGGADSPIALQQLVDAGIIDTTSLQVDKDTGMWMADDKAKDHISIAIQGLKAGVQANTNYMSNLAYEKHQTDKRTEKLLFAEQMTGHPGVVRASRLYTESASSIGTNLINYQIDEGGRATMQWIGQQAEIDDIYDSIDSIKAVSPNERQALKTFVSTLAGITADGAGLSTVLDQANADRDSSGRSRILTLLSKVNPGLSNKLKKALSQYKRIEKVANYAGGFYDAPVDVTERSDFRQLITDTGLSQALQQYRTAEAGGQDVEELGKQIDEIVNGVKLQIKKSGDKKMLKDFFNWMELEDATAELYKESAMKRRK